MSAGSGRIDLLGNPLSEMNYMRVAYEIDQIRIGVVPVNEYGKKHSPSAWKMTNSIESWSFSGYENQKTLVEVYTKEKYAALKLNGNMIGKKKTSKNGYATFKVKYQPGLLEAIGLDEKGNECCSTSLKSASSETIMNANLENFSTTTNDLIYINYSFSDESGEVKPLVNEEIKLQVEGGQLLAFGNACPYHKNKYQTNSNETYYGVALAIIRPTDLGKVVVSASSKYGSKTTEIEVFNNVKSC
jgi:beta-galactosidase